MRIEGGGERGGGGWRGEGGGKRAGDKSIENRWHGMVTWIQSSVPVHLACGLASPSPQHI